MAHHAAYSKGDVNNGGFVASELFRCADCNGSDDGARVSMVFAGIVWQRLGQADGIEEVGDVGRRSEDVLVDRADRPGRSILAGAAGDARE